MMVRRDGTHLTPGTEAGWFCRQKFLSGCWETLSEKRQGEEKTGLGK